MMIFWEAGLTMLAVPKTGTQAYAAMLADTADMVMRHPPRMKHMTAQRFQRRFRPLLPPRDGAPMVTIAVIREPLDWLGSWYRYRGRPALDGHRNSTSGISFDEFVLAYVSARPPAHAAVGSQFRFVSDDAGKILVDHLFDYADQVRLRSFLSERLGHEVSTPPPRNVSPEAELVLSAQTEQRLRRHCEADFGLYADIRRGRHLP